MKNCPLCTTAKNCAENNYPLLIQEFEYSWFVLGNHQFYKGYSLLIAKNHARELHELDEKTQMGLSQELMRAGRAVFEIFQPHKMNYASYGNHVEHIHWHIFPRYLDDPNYLECPFSNADKFVDYPTDPSEITAFNCRVD